jgi:hypothetical protein
LAACLLGRTIRATADTTEESMPMALGSVIYARASHLTQTRKRNVTMEVAAFLLFALGFFAVLAFCAFKYDQTMSRERIRLAELKAQEEKPKNESL